MSRPLITILLTSLLTFGLLLPGCGGGDTETPRSTEVIKPADVAPEVSAPAEVPVEEPAVANTDAPPVNEPMPEVAEAPVQPEPTTDPEPTIEPEPEPETASAAESGGTVFRGRVVVNGTAPIPPEIQPSGNDAFCIALKSIPQEEVVVSSDGGLANVFVWATKIPDGVEIPAVSEEPVVLDQEKCRFLPRALVAQVGQKLIVKNGDDTAHNTRITGLSISFNSIVGPNDRTGIPVDFQRSERVPTPVKCDIHGWMSCRILFADNPWHAVTNENGEFEIQGLPAGNYEFRLHHERVGYVEKKLELTIVEGESIEQTFEVEAAKLGE